MIVSVYSIFDSAAGAYTTPFFMHNDQMAIRAFADNVNTPGNNIHSNPQHFALFHIADYDDKKGRITPREQWNSLGTALEFKKTEIPKEREEILAMIQEIKQLLEAK